MADKMDKYISYNAVDTSRKIIKMALCRSQSVSFMQLKELYAGFIAPELELAIAWNEIVSEPEKKVDVDVLYSARIKAMSSLETLFLESFNKPDVDIKKLEKVKKLDSRKKNSKSGGRFGRFCFSMSIFIASCFLHGGVNAQALFTFILVLFINPFVYAVLMVAKDILTGKL